MSNEQIFGRSTVAFVTETQDPLCWERVYDWRAECEECEAELKARTTNDEVSLIEGRHALAVAAWQCEECGHWQSQSYSENLAMILDSRRGDRSEGAQ